MDRRSFLRGGAGAAVAAAGLRALPAAALRSRPAVAARTADDPGPALRVLGRTALRQPDSLPFPHIAAGTDTLPGIDHVVILMMENHSYDNFLGMLPRGDGFRLGPDGRPKATNPYGDGRIQHAFRMPTTCQLHGQPGQEWAWSHESYADGRLDGFVRSPSGPVAMGYWTKDDIPFTYGLASTFPIGDRWFCALLGQTDPNRRYLLAGTSSGMVDDIGTSAGNVIPDVDLALPPINGTIFDRLSLHGISWADYSAEWPTGSTPELFPVPDGVLGLLQRQPVDNFFTAAANGALPDVCLIDPNFGTQSQENPQDIARGEQFLASVVDAVGHSPRWTTTLLVITYDEHGGYYDHVPPPVALAPDPIPPTVQPGESTYEGFRRYGFRVPAVVVSAYARPGHVSHVVYDHTSILAMIEHKWNLPAMTYRDANANDLTDFLDMGALAHRRPTIPALPRLPKPARIGTCGATGAGIIPPPGSISRP